MLVDNHTCSVPLDYDVADRVFLVQIPLLIRLAGEHETKT